MTPEPLKITGPSYRVSRDGLAGRRTMRVWPTNYGPKPLKEMCLLLGIKRMTLDNRIRKYGYDYAGLLDPVNAKHVPYHYRPDGGQDRPAKKTIPLRREPTSITIGSWEKQQLLAEKRQGRR